MHRATKVAIAQGLLYSTTSCQIEQLRYLGSVKMTFRSIAALLVSATCLSFTGAALAASGADGTPQTGNISVDTSGGDGTGTDNGGNGALATLDTDAASIGQAITVDTHGGGAHGGGGRFDPLIPGGYGGAGGGANVSIDVPVASVDVNTTGGSAPIQRGGAGGLANIEVSAAVAGDVVVDTSGGPGEVDGIVSVTLKEGATVGGNIDAGAFGGHYDQLIFTLDLPTQAAYDAAKLSIVAAIAGGLGSNGSAVLVDSNTYNFSNFEQLLDQLTVMGLRPGTIVPVVITAPNGEQTTVNLSVPGNEAAATTPKYLRCDTPKLTAFLKNGEISITAKIPRNDGKRFLVGSLGNEPYIFTSGNPIGWRAEVETAGSRRFARIYDSVGSLVGSCRL